MHILEFELITNNISIIKDKYNYYLNKDCINFKDKDNIYKIDLINKIFHKKNKESIIKIDLNKNIIYIKLIKENLDLEIDLLDAKFINNNNEILIKYTIDDGERNINIVNIKY